MTPAARAFGLPTIFAVAACATTPPANDASPSGVTGGAGGSSTADAATTPVTQEMPLRAAARSSGRRIGAALGTYHFGDPMYQPVAAREFSSLTPENEMKWDATEPTQGNFSFAAGDALVAFANDHGMGVRGHCLVWHQALPAWAKALTGDALRAAMLAHVKGVAEHFRGKVWAWDVVNEAIADGTSGKLRGNSPFTALGPSFLEDAFRAAHDADPDALLYYNDYDADAAGTPKSDAVYALVRDLKDKGVPIHGVGLQMHLDPRHLPDPAAITANLNRLTAIGLNVNISELDVPVGAIAGDLPTKLDRQRQIFHDYVALCARQDGCDSITFWGFVDKYSWLVDPMWASIRGPGPHLPLLYDDAYQPKPAVVGVLDALLGR
jgi:endo-1,4-beta-xylanase